MAKTLADTAATVAAAASPAAGDGTVTLAPGESVKVDAAPDSDGELPADQRIQL